MDDIDKVLKEMEITNSITDMIIEDNRRRHVTVLVSERGIWTEDRYPNNEGKKKTIITYKWSYNPTFAVIIYYGEMMPLISFHHSRQIYYGEMMPLISFHHRGF